MEREKTFVEFFAFFTADVLYNFHARIAQFAHTVTVYFVVIVNGSDDHFRDAVADDGVGAGWSLPKMRTGFQVDVQRTVFQQSQIFHGIDGVDFSMRLATLVMVTFTDDAVVTHNDSSHHRVGSGMTQS